MNFSLISDICKSCNKGFDIQTNIPIILNNCDHTLCKSCMNTIITNDLLCPYCKEGLSEIKGKYKVNKDILNRLKEGNNQNNLNPINNNQPTEFWYKEKTKWYYISNNSKATGWIQWNNSWFYFQPETGQMMKGWINDDGKWYYLHSNGEMAEGWIKWNNHWYYLDPENGSMKTGWFEWSNQVYYLNPNSNGKMMKGWVEVEGKQYYLNPETEGAMATGHLKIKNKHYHFNDNGEYVNKLEDDNYNFH